jgi:hypothetical protein
MGTLFRLQKCNPVIKRIDEETFYAKMPPYKGLHPDLQQRGEFPTPGNLNFHENFAG